MNNFLDDNPYEPNNERLLKELIKTLKSIDNSICMLNVTLTEIHEEGIKIKDD
jgi:hypothetical protein